MPFVSLIVPVWNEEKTIENSILSLKKVDYPKNKLEIVVVNDGSTDSTSKILKKFAKDPLITILDNKDNQGKASRLNQGIMMCKGEFVATMDADSEVSPDILKKTIPYFKDVKTGAVTVSVRLKKTNNLLEKIIEIEYAIGLSLALKALSFFNAMHVTPGPFLFIGKRQLLILGYLM